MKALRPWLPVAAAAVIMFVGILWTTHTGRVWPDLPPLPHAVTVRSADIADLGAEISAPLFAPSRSSVAPDAGSAPPTPPPELVGVVIGGGKAVALVRSAGGDIRMLHAGETIDGWTIVGIAARQIIVARDGVQQTVALRFGGINAQGGSVSPAPPGSSMGNAASPSFDGLAAARHLGLPPTSIPLGSPLMPQR